jgi:hypothetical protein
MHGRADGFQIVSPETGTDYKFTAAALILSAGLSKYLFKRIKCKNI